MPKVRLCRDPLEDKFKEELIEFLHGGRFITIGELCGFLNYERKAVQKWVKDLPPFSMNGTKVKYSVSDVAAKLARSVAE